MKINKSYSEEMLSINYIYSVYYRVLPNFRKSKVLLYNYRELLKDHKVISYFKQFHSFQELPNMIKYLQKSQFYNHSFIAKIRKELEYSKERFYENLSNSTATFSSEHKVTISQKDIDYFIYMLKLFVFQEDKSFVKPTSEEVLAKQNLSASMGLPLPWTKKREYYGVMRTLLTRMYSNSLDLKSLDNDSSMFSAAFKRVQITSSNVKFRLVFAVHYRIACIESYFDVWLKKYISGDSRCHFVHGNTQLQISDITLRSKGYHCYSFDVEKFDNSIPHVVMILAYSVICYFLKLNPYQIKVVKFLRNYICTLPVFHPQLEMTSRLRGLSSGSGLTSTVGSICMFFFHCTTYRRYCRQRDIMSYFTNPPLIWVSSDDSFICLEKQIDVESYIAEMYSIFGIRLELEHYCSPEGDEVFFLGSFWKQGFPSRDINRLFGRIIFGSGNIPRMSPLQLFSSRCYEILGNVHNFGEIWRSFKIGPFPNRVFLFLELADFNMQMRIKSLMSDGERRGAWVKLSGNETRSLSSVWTTR